MSRAITTRLVRKGDHTELSATWEPYTVAPGEPDIYGHVLRRHIGYVEWEITAGPHGEPLAWGVTLTKSGAWIEATVAACRRDIIDRAREQARR